MNTIKQEQTELQKAQAALEAAKEAERQARQAAEQKKQEEARAKERESDRLLLEGILSRLKDHHKIEATIGTRGESPHIIFPNNPFYPTLQRSWSSKNVKVNAGYMTNIRSQTYAQKSDGSYNVEKIADKMAEVYLDGVNREKWRNKASENSKQSGEIVARLSGLHSNHGNGVSFYSSETDSQRVKVKMERAMTEDEAARFINALREAGLLEPANPA